MANSTTNLDFSQEYADTFEAIIKSGEQLVIDGACSIDTSTGYVQNAAAGSGIVPIGHCFGASDRDNSVVGLTGDGTKKAIIKSGKTFNDVSVIGTSGIDDVGALVYATDNQTYTVTKPTNGLPIGWVKKWKSATICDVQMFTTSECILSQYLTIP